MLSGISPRCNFAGAWIYFTFSFIMLTLNREIDLVNHIVFVSYKKNSPSILYMHHNPAHLRKEQFWNLTTVIISMGWIKLANTIKWIWGWPQDFLSLFCSQAQAVFPPELVNLGIGARSCSASINKTQRSLAPFAPSFPPHTPLPLMGATSQSSRGPPVPPTPTP